MTKATSVQLDSKILHFKKVLGVQNDFLEMAKKQYPKTYIYRQFIRDKYFISERTFWRYLETNAKRELKILEGELGAVSQ